MKEKGAVLIVGGAGYIGSHLNKELSKRHQTVVYDSLVYGYRDFVKWGDFILGDLADTEQLRLVFEKYPIKAVMHFAAFTYVGESVNDPGKYYHNNVANTLNLLSVMREYNVDCFIFSSTAATFGNPVEIPISETHPQNPINPYGRSKLMIENILSDFSLAYGLKYTSLRYFNAAGADPEGEIGEKHDPETHLIPLVLDAAIGKRENIEVFGTDYNTPDGTGVRDYIHVTDLANAHILALEYLLNGGSSQVFNLGNGNGYSVKEVIDAARAITGKKITTVETDRREGDPGVLIAGAARAKELLGWKPEYGDIETIIETAWNWHKK
ncbi:MAG: UDP-glucose 4-epimerase GalE [bacterium]|nr:UDP-glucose 4-epimerase GalE [bacterium]